MPREYINLISSDEEDEGAVSGSIIDLTSDDEEDGVTRTPIIDLTSDDDQASTSNMQSRSAYSLHLVKQHEIQKKKKRSLSKRSAFNNLLQHCRECCYKFTSDDPPLSKRGSVDWCVGCELLNAQIFQNNEHPVEVKHWLCTGELTKDDWDHDIDNSNEVHLLKKRVGQMKNRFRIQRDKGKTRPSYGQGLPTKEDLLNLVADQGLKCAVAGWMCHFGQNYQKSWSLSIDHIVPVSTAPAGMNPWVPSNIQVMCRLLNQIKGNHSDLEVRRWFETWKDANIHNY